MLFGGDHDGEVLEIGAKLVDAIFGIYNGEVIGGPEASAVVLVHDGEAALGTIWKICFSEL